MIYQGVELNRNGRVAKCPKCENEELDGKYCKICNIYLFNICTGITTNEPSEHKGRNWGDYNQGCKGLLDGNARFCHDCGSASSFFAEELLKSWDYKQTSQHNSNNQPVAVGTLYVEDDDLPW